MSDPTVLIADDHPLTRSGVRSVLEADGFRVVAEADCAPGAFQAAMVTRPDVCVLDIRMPGNGVRAAEQISSRLPTTRIVMLTVSVDDDDLFAAVRAGAVGYLPKETPTDRLPQALRAVLAGEAALPRGVVSRILNELLHRDTGVVRTTGGRAHLTEREWDVLERLARGGTTASIAADLFVSTVTVRTHVAAILRKMRAPDRDTAVALFHAG